MLSSKLDCGINCWQVTKFLFMITEYINNKKLLHTIFLVVMVAKLMVHV